MKTDPRDKRFYQLQKKEKSQLNYLEIAEYLTYSVKMIDYVSYKKARKNWIKLKHDLEEMAK